MSVRTWEEQQFILSMQQDKVNFEDEDRQNTALNQEFSKLEFTMA